MAQHTWNPTDPADVKPGSTVQLTQGLVCTVDSITRYKEDSRLFKLVIREGKDLRTRVYYQPAAKPMRVSGSPPATQPQPKKAAPTTKEAPMAAAKTEVRISGRVKNVIDFDKIKGLEYEEISRGRGTSLIVKGSKTALNKLSSECAEAFENRKGLPFDEYEDRYQAGQAVARIDEALNGSSDDE